MKYISKKTIFVLALFTLALWSGSLYYTFAIATPYTVGATTDPTCPLGPLEPNCFVTLLQTQDHGTTVSTSTNIINFTGSGVTITPSGGTVTVDIPGGGGGGSSYTAGTGLTLTGSTFSITPSVTNGYILRTVAGVPVWVNPNTVSLVSADNGLTNTSGNVQLGGPLIQNTDINTNGNNFSITDAYASYQSGGFGTTSVNWISKTISPTKVTVSGLIDLSPFGQDVDTAVVGRLDFLGGAATNLMVLPTTGNILLNTNHNFIATVTDAMTVNDDQTVFNVGSAFDVNVAGGNYINFNNTNAHRNFTLGSDGFSMQDSSPLSTDITVNLSSTIGAGGFGPIARNGGSFSARRDHTWEAGYYNLIDAGGAPHAQIYYGSLDAFNNITDIARIEANPAEAHMFYQGKMLKVTSTGVISTADLELDTYPSTRDDSGIFSPVNFLYTDSSGKVFSAPISLVGGGGSGWGLTGNAGTNASTNFIGTTDAQDFVARTTNAERMRILAGGNVGIGTSTPSRLLDIGGTFRSSRSIGTATLVNSNDGLTMIPVATALLGSSLVNFSGDHYIPATNTEELLNGVATDGIGTDAIVYIAKHKEIGGFLNRKAFNVTDLSSQIIAQQFLVGGGSFQANIDVNENGIVMNSDKSGVTGSIVTETFGDVSSPGANLDISWGNGLSYIGVGPVEQQKFFFDSINQAIRMGSVSGTEWDTSSLGNKSIAIGFADSTIGAGLAGPKATGVNSIAIGTGAEALGPYNIGIGLQARANADAAVVVGNLSQSSSQSSYIFGQESTINNAADDSYIIGKNSTVNLGMDSSHIFGNNSVSNAEGAVILGDELTATSFRETIMGYNPTTNTVVSPTAWVGQDRLFTIGNSATNLIKSDAFTILKNGKTGIGINNFETTANPEILQVGDASIVGAVARFTNSTGSCIINPTVSSVGCTSDERFKKNIQSLDTTSTLDKVLKLQGVSYNWVHDDTNTPVIGFVAQQLETIYPEFVMTDPNGYKAVAYGSLTPVLVEAIKELNIKSTSLQDITTPNTFRDSLIRWLGDVGNGIEKLFVKEATVEKLCVGTDGNTTCISKSELDQILSERNIQQNIPTTVIDTNTSPVETNPSSTPLVDVSPSIPPAPEDNTTTTVLP